MGYRTVVVFNNDQASTWENDPELGKKIARDMHRYGDGRTPLEQIGGRVLECTHADTQTLAILDGFRWHCSECRFETGCAGVHALE